MKNLLKFSALALSTTLLVACGGGGGGANMVTPLTGIFVDSPVEGLGYSTPTQSGKTLADGSFKYLSGENVSFSLFGKPILISKGFDFLTPFDITDSSVNPNYPINLIRFLLAVDEDGDATNGIKLPVFNGVFEVDFNQSLRDFEADIDGKIASFLNANANGRQLATVQAAVAHFNNSIANINPNYILNFAGKTATSKVVNTKCTNNVSGGFQYTFGQNSAQAVGSDGFANEGTGNCIVNPPGTISFNYVDLPAGEFLDCLPNCSYKQLNRISYVPSDTDGRTAVEWSWHTPSTNKIYTVKTILADPSNNNNPASLNTFYEVITLD